MAETEIGIDGWAILELMGHRRPGGRDLPLYRVVDRMSWTGAKHITLHEQLVDLARTVWKLSALVVDATGVGAGLASFLADQLARDRAA